MHMRPNALQSSLSPSLSRNSVAGGPFSLSYASWNNVLEGERYFCTRKEIVTLVLLWKGRSAVVGCVTGGRDPTHELSVTKQE